MRNLLMNCYYDGLTIEQTIAFVSRCYWETPTARQIENVKREIKETLNIEWKQVETPERVYSDKVATDETIRKKEETQCIVTTEYAQATKTNIAI